MVTEYRYHSAEHFAIEVELFTEDDLRDQFTEMVHDYRHHLLHSDEMDTRDERVHWEDRANLARDTFQTMFRGRFTVAFLESVEPEERMVQALLAWARELRPSNLQQSRISDTSAACSTALMSLTSDTNQSRPAAWPYIRKITVSLNAHILSKGLVLVDLPGVYPQSYPSMLLTSLVRAT